MGDLVPSEHLPLNDWWEQLKEGRMELGWGGAHAPERPRSIYVPDRSPMDDHRDEIQKVVASAHELATEIAARRGKLRFDHDTIGWREGTTVEALLEGSVYIIDLVTELMICFRGFYRLYRFADFQVTDENRQALQHAAKRLVQLRLLLVAIRAQEYVDSDIDAYICSHALRLV